MLPIVCLQSQKVEFKKRMYDQMVWLPENLNRNAMSRINMYKGSALRLLEVSYQSKTL